MAKRKKPNGPPQTDGTQPLLRRLTNVVALLAVKGEKQEQQIESLSNAGFENADIAQLLGTTAGTVAQTLYLARRKGRKGGKR